MKADYYRYFAEFKTDDAKKAAAEHARKANDDASNIACAVLPVTHPIRLGCALDLPMFQPVRIADLEKAWEIARTAFEDAIAALDNVAETLCKDSTFIMHLFGNNLTFWTFDREGAEP